MTRRRRLAGGARWLGAAVLGAGLAACSADPLPMEPRTTARSTRASAQEPDDLVLRWAGVELSAFRAVNPGPPRTSRALGVVHTAMYDAWAAYDGVALPTQPGTTRRPPAQRTPANTRRAVSFAAHRALVDQLPTQRAAFDALLRDLGYDPAELGDADDAARVGVAAADAVLAFRHADGANQLGDRSPGVYSDYTGYAPVNTPDRVVDPSRWQPLRVPTAAGGTTVQRFLAPHWGLVTPFALRSGSELRPAPPRAMTQHGAYVRQVEETLQTSAGLTAAEKATAEYWADGPNSETPPGHWCVFTAWVARRDGLGLEAQVKLFFALGNAMLDAGIAAWDAKRAYDAVRPVTAVRTLTVGRPVRAWGGPGLGTVLMPGEEWMPFQPAGVVTPPFPEYVSGHSTFSAAAATVLARFSGSDAFGDAVTLAPGDSRVEPGASPARAITLAWPTFSAAADEAGMSRRYGGIHFAEGDLAGRALGREVGARVWERAVAYWTGRAMPFSRPAQQR